MSCLPSIQIADRVRFVARSLAIVFLVGWGTGFWPFDDLLDRQGTPLGADFSMFYAAGQIAAGADWEQLYNPAEHQRRLHDLFTGLPEQFCLPYRYPPVVALMLSPLATFPYPLAWGIFTFCSTAAGALSVAWLFRGCDHRQATWRATAVWATLSWPLALEVVIGGQASLFALLIAVASSFLLKQGHMLSAGAVLALSAYKPNVLALFAVGVSVRYPRVVLGAVPVLAAALGLSCLAGTERVAEYAALTRQLASQPWAVETPYWKVHSLAPCFEWLFPGNGRSATGGIGLAAAITIGFCWRWHDSRLAAQPFATLPLAVTRPVALTLLLVINALFNPYTPIYDLVLLAAAAWFTAEAFSLLMESGRDLLSPVGVQFLLAGLFFGPHLSQGLAKLLGFQLFPLLLVAMTAWTARGYQRSGTPQTA